MRVRSADRKACAEAASHYADEASLATATRRELRDSRYRLLRATALLEEAVRTGDERALPGLADEVEAEVRQFDDRMPPETLPH